MHVDLPVLASLIHLLLLCIMLVLGFLVIQKVMQIPKASWNLLVLLQVLRALFTLVELFWYVDLLRIRVISTIISILVIRIFNI